MRLESTAKAQEFCHLSVETLELLSLVLDVLLLHSVASNASLLILPCSKHFISWLSWPLVLALRPSSPSTHGLWHGEDRKEKKSLQAAGRNQMQITKQDPWNIHPAQP